MPDDDLLSLKIVKTSSEEEVIAQANDLLVGRAAYETARRLYPNERIDYRNGACIVVRSDRSTLEGNDNHPRQSRV
jgi:hypothetical protein